MLDWHDHQNCLSAARFFHPSHSGWQTQHCQRSLRLTSFASKKQLRSSEFSPSALGTSRDTRTRRHTDSQQRGSQLRNSSETRFGREGAGRPTWTPGTAPRSPAADCSPAEPCLQFVAAELGLLPQPGSPRSAWPTILKPVLVINTLMFTLFTQLQLI